MSSPPEYQSLGQHDPDEPVDAKLLHAYPPQIQPANSGESSSAGRGVTTVNYTFIPRYPVKGNTEDAFGILYPSHEATAISLQRIFPTLAEYDLDRIELLAQMEDGKSERWGAIMDDAWEHITHQPPRRIKVQVKDGPGDEKRRKRRNCSICLCMCFSIVLVYATILFGIYLATRKK